MATEPTKHLEVTEYTHKGVGVLVEIDYDEGTIALKDKESKQAKKWLFSGRTIDYMQGWQDIFDAMKYAVSQATIALKKHQDAEDKKREAFQERVIKLAAKKA